MIATRDREGWLKLADGLAAAVVVMIPWSTSGTYILIAAWLIVFIPTSDRDDWPAVMRHPAAWLPVSLVTLAAFGMLWAEAGWQERLAGLASFAKLLAIPALFVQFRNSPRAHWVFVAFLVSCTILLFTSWGMVATGLRPWKGSSTSYGVPVRDYIAQSHEFILCAVGLMYVAFMRLSERRFTHVVLACALAALFLVNVLFIAPSRTGLVTVPILLIVLIAMHCRIAYAFAMAGLVLAVTATAWFSSTKIQNRILGIITEIHDYQIRRKSTSAGERVAFWTTSLDLVATSPLIGNGTGSVHQMFVRAAEQGGSSKPPTTNPHNQTFTVAIQLGLFGVALLFAMWISHFILFRGGGLASWIGLAVVTQNFIGSLFNNHLFDFTQAWIYMFGVGVAGAVMLANKRASEAGFKTSQPAINM